jgi:hypothetical protein
MTPLDRCPGCRARLADSTPTCPRCQCDLALVRQVERQAQAALGRALRAWAGDDVPTALAQARQALSLQDGPLARAVARCLAAKADTASPRAQDNDSSDRVGASGGSDP